MLGHLHVFLGEDEGADGVIEGEGVDAAAGGVDEDGGGTIDDVAGGDLTESGLEDGLVKGAELCRETPENAEDGADVDVDVDVGRSVEGVEDDDVLAGFGGRD